MLSAPATGRQPSPMTSRSGVQGAPRVVIKSADGPSKSTREASLEAVAEASAREFSANSTRTTMRAACRYVGLPGWDASLIRIGENALYRLKDLPVVVRIARTMDYWDDVVKEVDVSRWLDSNQFPAVRLHDVRQPIEVEGHPVTFWRLLDGRDGSEEDARSLGRLLHRLHALPAPANFTLPAEDVLARVEGRIKNAPVPSSDKDFLVSSCETLESEISRLAFPLRPGPTHGDAHVNNLIVVSGESILIDFERFAWGQPEWDLSMTATEYKTGGWLTDIQYGEFVDAYGFDVTEWDGFSLLRRAHEIKMTTWIMQNVRESSKIADEYRRRMHTIRTGIAEDWRVF